MTTVAREHERGTGEHLRIIEADALRALMERPVADFRQSIPVQMSRIHAALEREDLADLREAAHQIVGTIGAFSTIGAGVAATLEDAAIRDDRESCTALASRLDSLCDTLLEATGTLTLESLSL